jgi:hypothetical protein
MCVCVCVCVFMLMSPFVRTIFVLSFVRARHDRLIIRKGRSLLVRLNRNHFSVTHTHLHTCTHTNTYAYTNTNSHTRSFASTYTYTYTCTQHTCQLPSVLADLRQVNNSGNSNGYGGHSLTQTHALTHIHTHSRTHMYTSHLSVAVCARRPASSEQQ